MNILYVTLGFPPADGLGGPTKNAYEITRELALRGHNTTVFCTNLHKKGHKIYPTTIEDFRNGVRIVYLNTWSFKSWPGTLGPIIIPHLKSYLNSEISNFDIIHINGYRYSLASNVISQARKHNIPYVIQPRGELTYLGWTGYIKRIYDFFYRTNLYGSSRMIALSQKEKSECIQYSRNQVPIEFLTNGVRLEDYLPLPDKGKLRQKMNLPRDIPIILFLGRLNWIKGPDILIHAYALTKRQSFLILVGPDNGFENEISKLITDLRLDHLVKIVGPWNPETIMEVFVDADICVMTSRKELFPMTMVESCIAGVPMVLTETIEVASLVSDKAALVVPLEPNEIAFAIDKLLDSKDLRQKLSNAGPKIAKHTFSIQSVVDRLECIYLRSINSDNIPSENA